MKKAVQIDPAIRRTIDSMARYQLSADNASTIPTPFPLVTDVDAGSVSETDLPECAHPTSRKLPIGIESGDPMNFKLHPDTILLIRSTG